MTEDKEFFAELAAHGEDHVRLNLRKGAYRPGRADLAREWLDRQERERSAESEARNEASSREQIRIAHSAKNAAWAAAIAAIIAAISAIIAIASGK